GGEQTHGLLGLRAGLGRVDGEGQPVFGFHVHALVGQSHLPDHRMAEGLEPETMVADIVSAPTATELVTAGRQLTDEVVEFLVVGVPGGLGAPDRDGVVGEAAPGGVDGSYAL